MRPTTWALTSSMAPSSVGESNGPDAASLGGVLGDRLLDQAQGLVRRRPGVHRRRGRPTPPRLVLEAHRPGRMGRQEADQAVARPVLRAYAGSGEVIHSFARFQRTSER